MPRNPIQIKPSERNAFRLHLAYSILDGLILGILALNEFVFIKSLKGSEYQLSVLFQLTTVLLIFSVFFHEIIRRAKNKRRMIRITAIITRLPLLLLLFFPSQPEAYADQPYFHYLFLAIFLMYYLANPIVFPVINRLLKSNYSHENFGRLYSRATTWNKIVMISVTLLYGLLLDYDSSAFRYVFPVAAALGITSVFLLTRIKEKEVVEEEEIRSGLWHAVKDSIRRMFSILKTNKPYQHFEWGFMLYGFAFMSTISVITIFFDRALGLNYSGVAFYKNTYNIISIFLFPLFGRLIGRIDPRRFAAITFFSMMMFLLFLIVTEHFPYFTTVWGIKLFWMMIPYIIFQSLFAATMGLLWSIGSVYFCKKEEAEIYQAIHLTMTGERALFAPLLGMLFYTLAGFTFTFAVGAGMLAAGVVVMFWSMKKFPVNK
ncbi:MAG: MFS transporter [Bacteroidota bacterium]